MFCAVHRVVEQRVAASGDSLALVDPSNQLSYRELNARANALARALIGVRFRRGAHAIVSMERSTELAIALLAVLKAGGAYSWIEADGAARLEADGLEGIDLLPLMSVPVVTSPNLPILTRGNDPACLLPDDRGRLAVVVPHEAIVSLAASRYPDARNAGAFELWAGLMAGA